MSDQHEKHRKGWVRGEVPGEDQDEFARHAARGREELGGADEAASLLSEIDGLIGARFSGADAGAKIGKGSSEEPAAQSGVKTKVRGLGRFYAIAASLLLLMAAGWWWSRQGPTFHPETTYLAAFEPYANELTSRPMGGPVPDSPAIDRRLAAASLAYDRRDYVAAADSFALYLNLAPAAAPASAQLYYGISLLAANRSSEAIPVLTALRNDAEYTNPATWYLGLAQLRAGKPAAARAILESVAAESPFRARADKLLEAIP